MGFISKFFRLRVTHPVEEPKSQVPHLEANLWGGFSASALADLEAIKRKWSSDGKEPAKAALALAYWYAAQGNAIRACDNAIMARQINHLREPTKSQILLEAHCLVQTGQHDNARLLLKDAMYRWPNDPTLCFAMANTYSADPSTDEQRFSWINVPFERAGLIRIVKTDPQRSLSIGNISGAHYSALKQNSEKVSIIIPLYNAQDSIQTTLTSLVEQTWRNFEVLIVDDCSTDGSIELVEAFAKADSRFKVLRQPKNQGSYSARNRALEVATGEFITVHDAGDWSHPQKIEIQAKHLHANPGEIGNYSRMSRTFDNMVFAGKYRWKNRLIDWNPSSVFFRRRLLDHVGGWDAVRVSADAEFVRRVNHCLPGTRIATAFDVAPLSFMLEISTSLTKNAANTHGVTTYHGARREYREAADHWYSTNRGSGRLAAAARLFPVPGIMLPDREQEVRCDVLLIADFNLAADIFDELASDIAAARSKQKVVAVLQWSDYRRDALQPLNRTIRQMAQDGEIRIVCPGEHVSTSTTIIASASLFNHMIDLCPKIATGKIIVKNARPGDYEPSETLAIRRNLFACFGSAAKDVPLSAPTLAEKVSSWPPEAFDKTIDEGDEDARLWPFNTN